MAVIPRYEFRRRVASGKVFAWNSHLLVRLGSRCKADLMVMPFEVVEGYVLPDVDVAEETESRLGGDFIEHASDVLDLFMVWRDTESYQAVRGREAVVHIDCNRKLLLFEKVAGGVKSRRTRADDSYSQGVVRSSWFRHESFFGM